MKQYIVRIGQTGSHQWLTALGWTAAGPTQITTTTDRTRALRTSERDIAELEANTWTNGHVEELEPKDPLVWPAPVDCLNPLLIDELNRILNEAETPST